jgi:hypothetical protein
MISYLGVLKRGVRGEKMLKGGRLFHYSLEERYGAPNQDAREIVFLSTRYCRKKKLEVQIEISLMFLSFSTPLKDTSIVFSHFGCNFVGEKGTN